MVDVPTFPTANKADTSIGGPCDILLVGDSFERKYIWKVPDPTETPDSCCKFDLADFTGYIPAAAVLDANNVVLEAMTVVPNPGDATGAFTVSLLPSQVTTALRTSAVRWRLTITSGSVTKTLIYSPFKVT